MYGSYNYILILVYTDQRKTIMCPVLRCVCKYCVYSFEFTQWLFHVFSK